MAARVPIIRRLLSWRALFAANLLAAAFVSVGLGREWVRQQALRDEIGRLQGRADELAARELELFALTSSLRTESFIEREARLKLGLKKPGESVVVVRGAADAIPVADPEGGGAQPSGGDVANPAKWWYYFFDRETFERLETDYGNES